MNYKELKIDLKEIEDNQARNRKQRMDFVKFLAEWIKKTPNKVWSKQQKILINSQIDNTQNAGLTKEQFFKIHKK